MSADLAALEILEFLETSSGHLGSPQVNLVPGESVREAH